MTASRAPGEPGGAGRRTSKSQFQAGAGVACTHGVRNTSCPTLTSTYASTTACFCPLAAYLCSHWLINFRRCMLAVCLCVMRATRVHTETMQLPVENPLLCHMSLQEECRSDWESGTAPRCIVHARAAEVGVACVSSAGVAVVPVCAPEASHIAMDWPAGRRGKRVDT